MIERFVCVDFYDQPGIGFITTMTLEEVEKMVKNPARWKYGRVPKIEKIYEESITIRRH